ncbi:MAG: ABC transporter substrate-binding protein, partial [Alphaproteobacteria bacterium]|nr:ABC transporter substrate-binding protein [Alphaproteobacteria bacterium]
DRTARLQALRTGAIDIAADLNPEDRGAVEQSGGKFLVRPTGRVQVISFDLNKKNHPITDVRVRRALNYAIDRQAIVDVLLGGATTVAAQPAVPQAFGRIDNLEPYPFDPYKARALLAEAGHATGFDMTLSYPAATMAGDDAAYQQIAADLGRVGVRVTVESATYAQQITRIRTGGWPGEAFGMDFNNMPALDALWAMRVHSCIWPAPWHCREDWVPLHRTAETATSVDERLRLTRELARKFHDEPAGIFLWDLPGLDGASPNITGIRSGLDFLDFSTLDKIAP